MAFLAGLAAAAFPWAALGTFLGVVGAGAATFPATFAAFAAFAGAAGFGAAGFLAAGFLAGAFLAADLAGALLAAGFATAGVFFAAGFSAAAFLVVTFFTAALVVAFFGAAAFLAAAGFFAADFFAAGFTSLASAEVNFLTGPDDLAAFLVADFAVAVLRAADFGAGLAAAAFVALAVLEDLAALAGLLVEDFDFAATSSVPASFLRPSGRVL